MRRYKGTISLDSIKAHCRRSNFTLNRLVMNNTFHGFNGMKLEYLLRTCKKLQHLEYYGAGFVHESLNIVIQRTSNIRTIITGQNLVISPATVFSALKTCRQIVHAEFHNVDCFRSNLLADWFHMESLETLTLASGVKNSTSFVALNLVSVASNPFIIAFLYVILHFSDPCVLGRVPIASSVPILSISTRVALGSS
jgi:hypothetical protein